MTPPRDHKAMSRVSLIECAVCGSRQNLTRHHIVERGKTQNDEPENIAVVCDGPDGCHRKIHADEIDLGIHLTPSQGAKSVLLLGTVYAAWQLLYPSESRATSGVSWPE